MTIVATLILFCGMLDDLRSQKVHNKLILVLFFVALLSLIALHGVYALPSALLSFALALAFGIPLVLVGAIGGGDMKLLAVFGLATHISAVLGVAIYSLLWGALLGLVRAGFMGKLQDLVLSTTQLLWVRGATHSALKIPYTVALFFGWLTHLTLVQVGVSPW